MAPVLKKKKKVTTKKDAIKKSIVPEVPEREEEVKEGFFRKKPNFQFFKSIFQK